MKKQFHLSLIFGLLHQTFASFCGRAGVPFSLEVLPSGAPVLGCAQPTCVASLKGKKDDSNFLTNANGQADGFMREDDRDSKVYSDPYGNKLLANCSGQFSELSCSRKDQWVGGIEYIDHPRQPLILQCCTFPGLRFSQDVGLTNVGPGEAITGGEVIRDGRQISFDVIANVRKVVDTNTHIVSYEVTVRRMHCLPDPPEPVVSYFEKDVGGEIVKVLTRGTDRSTFRREKTLSREKLDEVQGRKVFTDIIAHRTNEKKPYQKTEFEEKESVKRDISSGNEAMWKRREADIKAEITRKPAFTQSFAFPLGNHKSEIASDGAASDFSSENGIRFASVSSPVNREGAKGFDQQQISEFGRQLPQLPPLRATELESVQPQASSQAAQPQQASTHQPCTTQCQQSPCLLQRCNQQGLDPVFGIPTFAPPLFPLTLPTLPTLGFPTAAPQTLPSFVTISPPSQPPPQPLSGYLNLPNANIGHSAPFNSLAYFSTPNTERNVKANGKVTQLSISPITHTPTTPASTVISTQPPAVLSGKPILLSGNKAPSSQATLKPLSTFEEFMARLGYRNISFATLAPAGLLLLPPEFTAVTSSPPLSPLLYATTIVPENRFQVFVPRTVAEPSQLDQYHRSVLYVPKQWSSTNLDDAALQRTGGLRQT
ncbi:unnamed protein product [Litomosoides sigmodontis]|uniref:Uncharacterized protein n=1 Tax=Litomosoides sigmodontis TaxID=42156 RepID=A0A3P6T5H0_LITSI|nr:unnamed protein product [Litomosoides sigmodontis]